MEKVFYFLFSEVHNVCFKKNWGKVQQCITTVLCSSFFETDAKYAKCTFRKAVFREKKAKIRTVQYDFKSYYTGDCTN